MKRNIWLNFVLISIPLLILQGFLWFGYAVRLASTGSRFDIHHFLTTMMTIHAWFAVTLFLILSMLRLILIWIKAYQEWKLLQDNQ